MHDECAETSAVYAIVSSHTLATNLARKATGKVTASLLRRTAGGHNARRAAPCS